MAVKWTFFCPLPKQHFRGKVIACHSPKWDKKKFQSIKCIHFWYHSNLFFFNFRWKTNFCVTGLGLLFIISSVPSSSIKWQETVCGNIFYRTISWKFMQCLGIWLLLSNLFWVLFLLPKVTKKKVPFYASHCSRL